MNTEIENSHAEVVKKTRRKKTREVRLVTPIFLDDESLNEVDMPLSHILKGGYLYGDDSKCKGLKDARIYAQEHKKAVRVIEAVVKLKGEVQGSYHPYEEDLLSGEYGMIRIVRHSVRPCLTEKIDELIKQEGRQKYPNLSRLLERSQDDWLKTDPSIANVLFKHFPDLSLVVVDTLVHYSKQLISVAIINPEHWEEQTTISVPYYKDIKVNIQRTV